MTCIVLNKKLQITVRLMWIHDLKMSMNYVKTYITAVYKNCYNEELIRHFNIGELFFKNILRKLMFAALILKCYKPAN